jgi:hypothetical protein
VIARGSGESTRSVTEQLAFEHVLGHGAAIDGYERSIAPRACLVDGARQQLLARAALAGDEHARIGASHHVCLRQLLFHDRAARHEIRAPVLVIVHEAGDLQCLLYLVEQLLLFHRLGEKAEGTHLCCLHGIGNGSVSREQYDLQPRPTILQLFEQSDAIELVHAQIGDHQVGAEARGRGQRLHAVFHRFHVVLLRPKADRQQTQQARVIIDNQNSGFALGGLVH